MITHLGGAPAEDVVGAGVVGDAGVAGVEDEDDDNGKLQEPLPEKEYKCQRKDFFSGALLHTIYIYIYI